MAPPPLLIPSRTVLITFASGFCRQPPYSLGLCPCIRRPAVSYRLVFLPHLVVSAPDGVALDVAVDPAFDATTTAAEEQKQSMSHVEVAAWVEEEAEAQGEDEEEDGSRCRRMRGRWVSC